MMSPRKGGVALVGNWGRKTPYTSADASITEMKTNTAAHFMLVACYMNARGRASEIFVLIFYLLWLAHVQPTTYDKKKAKARLITDSNAKSEGVIAHRFSE